MIDTTMLGQLAGKHVKGPDDENIGKIADVYESTDGGGGTFATVNTGLFGGGSSFFPLDAAELRGDDVVVPYSKSFVKDAPACRERRGADRPRGAAPVRVLRAGRRHGAPPARPRRRRRPTTTATTGTQGVTTTAPAPTAATSTAPSATTPAAPPRTTR